MLVNTNFAVRNLQLSVCIYILPAILPNFF